VSFAQQIEYLLDNTRDSLGAFAPELTLCATIVVLLLAAMLLPRQRSAALGVMLLGSGVALVLAVLQWPVGQSQEIFTGMLVFDGFSVFMRCLLLSFVLLFTVYTRISGVPDRATATEFYVLVLGAVLGMCLMVSANHMLIVFLGIEMASVPSYALAGILKQRRAGSEAALKFAVFGAGTAGVMLYGISLLVGTLGSAHLPTMTAVLVDMLQSGAAVDRTMVLALGGLMLMVGLAFKLSAVPFHFWTPDVFEGATAEVAAFLSIASKAAALALLTRLALGFGVLDSAAGLASLEGVRSFTVGLISLLAAITCTFGNLAAYGQTNMKRLLAYSTIAHAGYMMMAVAAAVALVGTTQSAVPAVAALGFYMGVYLFMNLAAFAAVAFLRNAIGSEEIADYAGLIRRSPALAVCLSIVLFSLVGLPPLAGFAAKFTIFASLANAGLIVLLVIGGLNTVLSLFYYLRVVRVITMDAEPEDRPAAKIPASSLPGGYLLVVTMPLLVLGLWWVLFDLATAAAKTLL